MKHLLAVIMLCAFPAFADEDHNSHHDDFYQFLQRPGGGGSCCSNRDCRPADARVRAGHWQAFIQKKWVDIPDNVILRETHTPDGGAHVCAVIDNDLIVPLCFIPPLEA